MVIQKLYLLAKLLKSQWYKPEELKKIQEKMLRAVIVHAYKHTIFYRRLWKSVGVKPGDVKSLKDLQKLPIVSRDDVSKNFNLILALNYKHLYRLGKITVRRTSGFSNTPLKIVFDERGWNYLEAIYLRSLLSLGYNPRKPIAFYWYEPFQRKFYNSFGLLRKYLIPSKLSENEQLKLLKELNPPYLCYYPSSLFFIAKKMDFEDIGLSPKFIVTQGEILSKGMRKKIESVFNAPVFDFYATAETGITGWECKEKCGYHINADNIILNIVKDGEEVSPYEEGSVILTSLTNYFFPLVRYRIGDVAILRDDLCSCGRGLPLLKQIKGREENVKKLNVLIRRSPTYLIDKMSKIKHILKFRIIIKDAKINIEVVPFKGQNKNIIQEIKDIFSSERLPLSRIKIVKNIPKLKSGKIKLIEVN